MISDEPLHGGDALKVDMRAESSAVRLVCEMFASRAWDLNRIPGKHTNGRWILRKESERVSTAEFSLAGGMQMLYTEQRNCFATR